MSQPQSSPATPAASLLKLDPVAQLLERSRQSLGAQVDFSRPVRLSRAPGRLDVMGGIADYTGSLVCEATLDRAAAVLLQGRTDRQVQVFSFNLYDEHQPFTFCMPLEALANNSAEHLRCEFDEPGRKWAGYLAGCLFMLHEQRFINLGDPSVTGMNMVLLSTVPLGAGVSSSAAIEVATMMNLRDHFQLQQRMTPMELSAMCQQVENRIVGAPCGIMDQVASCCGQSGALMRMICQPHELQSPLRLPGNIRVIGINSHVKHSVGGGMYGKTRCAAFMGHKIILKKMAQMGQAAGRTLVGDPMGGYLANLDADDYKRLFREHLPQQISGREFLAEYGPTIDRATRVDEATEYHVRQATDHHVLEARRVREFCRHIEEAAAAPAGTRDQGFALDKAGHLMYASHRSYGECALLGASECDLLVDLVRREEKAGLYGAKITGGGSGGTVAVLADISPKADAAIARIMQAYQQATGNVPEAFLGSSPGAWQAGTAVL